MKELNLTVLRTEPGNKDFLSLTNLLDDVLSRNDGEDHPFFAQFNKANDLDKAVLIYSDNIPVSCGAIKKYSDSTAEIKRMYVKPEYRGKGIAKKTLHELEYWASELNYTECILETGKDLVAAVGLYKESGYEVISNYGQYKGIDKSICFRKILRMV